LPMTLKQLMSHTAGFAGRTEYPPELRAGDLQHMIDYIAKQPLSFQPGKEWRYGPSVDILGYIIEKITGKGVDEVLQERLFEPLGMVDTGYVLPESKVERLVSTHKNDADGNSRLFLLLAHTMPRGLGISELEVVSCSLPSEITGASVR
jgi:CubicO group peptidase (beta-lactamase class C family)